MPLVDKWLCYGCGKLIGFTNRETNQIQIKWKQLSIKIIKGQVIVDCRYCGTPNIMTDDDCRECPKLIQEN